MASVESERLGMVWRNQLGALDVNTTSNIRKSCLCNLSVESTHVSPHERAIPQIHLGAIINLPPLPKGRVKAFNIQVDMQLMPELTTCAVPRKRSSCLWTARLRICSTYKYIFHYTLIRFTYPNWTFNSALNFL